MIALLVSALVIGRLIAVRSIKPVRDVVATVEEIRRSGDLSKRVEAPKGDDIGQLAENFNSLFDKVEQMMETEKKFTSDISHELKTPLAVIASQSEYALEDEAYRAKALKVINTEAMRMSEMISRLRLLAGSDSDNLIEGSALRCHIYYIRLPAYALTQSRVSIIHRLRLHNHTCTATVRIIIHMIMLI